MPTPITTSQTVTWHEAPLDRRHTRRIVPAAHYRRACEADAISATRTLMPEDAPMARALLGCVAGDVVTVQTPAGAKTVTVREVGS